MRRRAKKDKVRGVSVRTPFQGCNGSNIPLGQVRVESILTTNSRPFADHLTTAPPNKRGGRSKRNKWLAQAYRGWLTHRHTNETKLCQVKGVQTCRGGTRLTTDFIKYYCFRTLWASLQKVGSGLHFIASIDLYPSSSRNRRPVSSSTRALIRLFPKFKSRALRLHASSNKL